MARPKLGEGDTFRLQIKISEEELAAIDDWRFANRVNSRSEAVRRLCQIGRIADETPSMTLALAALAHFIRDETAAVAKEKMQSEFSLEEDVKRLCWAVVEERSKIYGFKGDNLSAAIKMTQTLTEDFRKTAQGTHLDPFAKPKR